MRFQFQVIDDLPKLAWCATVKKGDYSVRVIHGPWVENRGSFFCEGAWDGKFQSGEFSEGFFAGSGGRVNGYDEVLFATPSHTLERLFSVRISDTLHVSNSLAFLLSVIDDKLDPGYFFYRAIFHSIRYGIKKCRRSIPTLRHHRIRLHYYCNLIVSPDITVTERPKERTEDFTSFEHYNSFLKETVMRICQNAMDEDRVIKYSPIATVSSGYDSAASSVFAHASGCTEVVTFRDQDDSGAETARAIGMNVLEYDRHDYMKVGASPEAEFWACGINAMDAIYLAFEKTIQQKILFMGSAGDIVWNKNRNIYSREINRWDPYLSAGSSETGLTEFRLRVGFIQLPLPFIGITSQPSIHFISVSKEMKPWSIGGSYDKPIPRRILEESGVNRGLFGQGKKKGGWLLGSGEMLKRLTEKSQSDFANFLSENWSLKRRVAAKVFSLLVWSYHYLWFKYMRIINSVKRDRPLTEWPSLVPRAVARWLLLPIGKESLLPHWGISKISVRYRIHDLIQ